MSQGPLLRPGELRTPGQIASNADRTQRPPANLGPQPYQPSQPQATGANWMRRIALPGEDYPAAGSIPVDVPGEHDIPGGGGAGSTVVLSTILVPDTYRFRVAAIGFGAEDESGLRFLSWSAFVDPPQAPIYGYNNMPVIGSIQYPSWVFIVLGSSVTLTIRATNNAPVLASVYHYFSRVQGWFYHELEG